MTDPLELLDHYDVTWDSPSADISGTMPLGNGDVALNVWVERSAQRDGELLLLIAKSDAWDENSINLKLGRIRITLRPNPFVDGAAFRQTLRLRSGQIEIFAADIALRIRVDANHPIIHVDAEGTSPFQMQAALEMWRSEPRQIKTQTGDIFKNLQGPDPYPTIVWPDQVLSRGSRIIWCHHNQRRQPDGFEVNMKLQGLGGFIAQMPHPLAGRTFGAGMQGAGFSAVDAFTLAAPPRSRHRLAIHVLTLHPATIEQWQQRIEAMMDQPQTDTWQDHQRWWSEFWNRSWIYVTSESDPDNAFRITQSYILQRFMNACAGRGASPIKFNGSLFSVGKPEDPDFRRWGGPGFWFMNQRLIYWPMLAAGDLDLMLPWLRMYRDQLPLQRHRTRTYWGHGGAHYPETLMFWGAEVSAHYEWVPFEQRATPEAQCPYVRYYWSGGIELTLILLNCYLHSGDEQFARELLLPIADAVTQFFDEHYPRDSGGRIRFEPAQALETWHEAVNPLPEIAGLRYVLSMLLDEFGGASADLRRRWARMLDELPPIPIGQKDGRRVVLPAERFDRKKNTENPELYCVFPYRLFGLGKPDLQLARDTFAARLHQSHNCWSQDDIQMALLGLTDQARQWISQRASPAAHSDSRFPGFWNAFHDWVPDMDHGGVLQLALQLMLMQCEGRQILLLPAWPRQWDADFKLHAPRRTIVAGRIRDGKLLELRVTPSDRAKDVAIYPPQSPDSSSVENTGS